MKTKEVLNKAKIHFFSRSSNEGFARVAVAAFFAQLDPTVEEISDIKTAVSEAVTNAIVHGYREKVGEIIIEMQIRADNQIYIRVTDRGCGIADIAQAMEPMYTTSRGEEERSGLGFTVMQSFMDKVKVTSRVDKGTIVTMTKTIVSRGEYER